jgi:hypothetical protein
MKKEGQQWRSAKLDGEVPSLHVDNNDNNNKLDGC